MFTSDGRLPASGEQLCCLGTWVAELMLRSVSRPCQGADSDGEGKWPSEVLWKSVQLERAILWQTKILAHLHNWHPFAEGL